MPPSWGNQERRELLGVADRDRVKQVMQRQGEGLLVNARFAEAQSSASAFAVRPTRGSRRHAGFAGIALIGPPPRDPEVAVPISPPLRTSGQSSSTACWAFAGSGVSSGVMLPASSNRRRGFSCPFHALDPAPG